MTNQPTDPIVYIPVPVSEKPTENKRYGVLVLFQGNEYIENADFISGEWINRDDFFGSVTHWLRPVPLSSITNEIIKELEAEVKKLAYLADYWQEKKK